MANEFYKPAAAWAEGNARNLARQRATYEHGTQGELPAFYRFVVVETIFDPTLIDANKVAYFEHSLEVSNIHLANVLPRNTIVARRVLTAGASASAPAMFLFPFFPPSLSFPCQPGEHVWVMFENQTGTKNDLGFWFCRIVEPGFVEDVNHTHAPRSLDPTFTPGVKDQFEGTDDPEYEFRNGRADVRDGNRYTIAETAMISGEEDAYERLLTDTDGGKLSVMEPIPRYKKRPGDVALEGTNNTLIVLGRDRTGAVATYKVDDITKARIVDGVPSGDSVGPGAGAIDIVVGRGQTDDTLGKEIETKSINGGTTGNKELGKSTKDLVEGEGNPNFIADRSRVYIAQRTKVDQNFGTDAIGFDLGKGIFQGGDPTKKDIKDSDTGDGAIVIKSDKVRLIARSDLEIIVTGFLARDEKGRIVEDSTTDTWAVVAIKANGDIVFRPSRLGYVKLGGDDADKGIVCTDVPIVAAAGGTSGPPLLTTMGGSFAATTAGAVDNAPAIAGQGKYANKVLIK